MSDRELRVLLIAAAVVLSIVGAIRAGKFIWGRGQITVRTHEPAELRGARLDINTAAVHELDMLPGIGPTTAEAIVKNREEKGAFRSLEDLMRVRGVGPGTVEAVRPHAMCPPPQEGD